VPFWRGGGLLGLDISSARYAVRARLSLTQPFTLA